jgi:CubicO group peptidase (beta-lactamase class C family)
MHPTLTTHERDLLDWFNVPLRPFRALCRVPDDLSEVTAWGEEIPAREVGLSQGAVESVWERVETLYRTGLYPAVQVCIRRRGHPVLHRALGHAAGNAPDDAPDAPKVAADTGTPFTIYSASKAITAMVIHKLDEQGLVHLDDPVCEYIPEFGVHGKEWITLRHVLTHRAGIPNLPPEVMDLELLEKPEEVLRILCEARPVLRPGRRLAYHAITGGFVLGEVVRRVTGHDIREVLRKEVQEPLGFRWTNYGVAPEHVELVAENAVTGSPVPPPIGYLLRRALGVSIHDAVALSNDPRFLTAIIPAANVVTTAEELSAFYQCLLDGGELGGVRVFDPRTVRRAAMEQTYREVDLTLVIPLRYGLGFMLGGWVFGPFGPDAPRAYGHIGFTNIISWADPERELAVAIITSGKPVVTLDVVRLWQVLSELNAAMPKINVF